jgi:predicted ATP-grasp superfamily ATP-dependent carboligase
MDSLRWDRKPELRKPLLVCAFKGWNDAADSATTALEFIGRKWDASRFAAIDPEEFFDFQVTRPTVHLTEGRTREISWPEPVLFSGTIADADRDVVLLTGAEPNLHWKTFCATVIEAARELGVELVVSLGALLADVPHTRPVQITGIAGDEALVERLGFSQTRYEGPTGIVGVLQDAFMRAGFTCASLWAPVPHYVAALPSPKAALALVETLATLIEVEIDVEELERASVEYEERLDEAVANEPEVKSLVERLEQQMDEAEVSFGDLPSGDSIAREFQRFLRDQGRRGNDA